MDAFVTTTCVCKGCRFSTLLLNIYVDRIITQVQLENEILIDLKQQDRAVNTSLNELPFTYNLSLIYEDEEQSLHHIKSVDNNMQKVQHESQ